MKSEELTPESEEMESMETVVVGASGIDDDQLETSAEPELPAASVTRNWRWVLEDVRARIGEGDDGGGDIGIADVAPCREPLSLESTGGFHTGDESGREGGIAIVEPVAVVGDEIEELTPESARDGVNCECGGWDC